MFKMMAAEPPEEIEKNLNKSQTPKMKTSNPHLSRVFNISLAGSILKLFVKGLQCVGNLRGALEAGNVKQGVAPVDQGKI
jgi:hypothetical protein